MTTLLELYNTLFPDEPGASNPFDMVPKLPADVFAFAGYALERSGAYHHVAPDVAFLVSSGYRRLEITDAMRQDAIKIGEHWRTAPNITGYRLPKLPTDAVQAWQQLKPFQNESIFSALKEEAPAPYWWGVCLKLLMISDEASADTGFSQENVFSKIIQEAYIEEDVVSGDAFRRIQSAPISLSTASEDVVCVQSKSRTPSVGCTFRSLSHHLAMLPPKGVVKARWIEPPLGATV